MNHKLVFRLICMVIGLSAVPARAENPLIRNVFSADPAALVHNGRVYLYTGHDEAPPNNGRFVMRDWRCYSSDDMIDWTDHGSVLSLQAFSWARANAWASQVIERNGKFYWYAPMSHRTIPGFAIGVAVADSPLGPFKGRISFITMSKSPSAMSIGGTSVSKNYSSTRTGRSGRSRKRRRGSGPGR